MAGPAFFGERKLGQWCVNIVWVSGVTGCAVYKSVSRGIDKFFTDIQRNSLAFAVDFGEVLIAMACKAIIFIKSI